MTATENGELPAHPTQYLNEHSGNVESSGGLTKREMFAMAAMQGLCASQGYASTKSTVDKAIEIADELLKQL